jgi:hypothetical protein
MINELERMWKEEHLPGGTEENHKKVSQDIRSPC